MRVSVLNAILRGLPDTAHVLLEGQPLSIGALDYDRSRVHLRFDDDEDIDEAYAYSRWWLKFLDFGLGEGYPLCCVLFFTFVWSQCRWWPKAWWGRPTADGRIPCIACPYHRVFLPTGVE